VDSLLQINNLISKYGHIQALHGISMEVGEKEIVALIGSNGAGKTTLLNSISGHVEIEGSVKYNGKEIKGQKPHVITRKGLLHVPEGRHVFPGLTVEENLQMGTVAWNGIKLLAGHLSDDLDYVYQCFPRLKERRKQLAWSLSGGEQQMMVIGRALMGHPKMLMLDEPSMGLAPIIIEEVFERITEINNDGIPILLVEQNAALALSISNRAYVLERGNITYRGLSKDLANNDKVKEAYLGKKKNERRMDK